jgi:hypothetical protein
MGVQLPPAPPIFTPFSLAHWLTNLYILLPLPFPAFKALNVDVSEWQFGHNSIVFA